MASTTVFHTSHSIKTAPWSEVSQSAVNFNLPRNQSSPEEKSRKDLSMEAESPSSTTTYSHELSVNATSRAPHNSENHHGVPLAPIFRPYSDKSSEEGSSSGCSNGLDSAYGTDASGSPGLHKPGMEAGQNVKAVVQNRELWKLFSDIGNEMIVTKPGR